MFKRLFLLAGVVLALVTSVSADIPFPPCDPDCVVSASASR
ncbi:MAG TPA: hypothetical protein VK724_09750 [Bryobacteraceae bacterium]|jgi:hypothetical protein|nr:hypothetical protein [Bryobacteraceae bacterium]